MTLVGLLVLHEIITLYTKLIATHYAVKKLYKKGFKKKKIKDLDQLRLIIFLRHFKFKPLINELCDFSGYPVHFSFGCSIHKIKVQD